MKMKNLLLAGVSVSLLSIGAHAEQPLRNSISFNEAQKEFNSLTRDALSDEFLTGSWNLIGMTLADDKLQSHFSVAPGFDAQGIHNEDGSVKNVLKIEKVPPQDMPKTFDDTPLLITLESFSAKDKMSALGPRPLQWSSKTDDLQFKRDIINSETGKPCKSNFEYTCHRFWTPYTVDGARLLCEMRFRLDASEQFDSKLMTFGDSAISYLMFHRVDGN